jgi:DHA2 family multidrug resistance protein-like MFS transporter
MTPSDTHARATSREWIGLAVIALPCAVYAMDLTVLNLALPAISAALRPSGAELLWIIDIYGFFVAGFLITMGTLGDRIGRRKLLLIGAAAFAIALGDRRVLDQQRDADRNARAARHRRRDPGAVDLVADPEHVPRPAATPVRDRHLDLELFGRRCDRPAGRRRDARVLLVGLGFLLAVPVMLMLLVVGPSLLPEYRDPAAGRIDLVSVGQSLAAVLAVVYGLKQIAEHGPALPSAAVLIGGLVLAAVFVRRQSRLDYPLLDMRLFRQAAFSAAIAAYALSCLAMFGVYIFITQYLQGVLGLSPLHAGIAIIPWSLAFVVGSLGAPKLARRWSPISAIVGGLAVAGVGFALLAFVDSRYALAVSSSARS